MRVKEAHYVVRGFVPSAPDAVEKNERVQVIFFKNTSVMQRKQADDEKYLPYAGVFPNEIYNEIFAVARKTGRVGVNV